MKKTDMTPQQIRLMEEIGNDICNAVTDIPFEIDGTVNASVQYKDGNYKTKSMMNGWEFFLKSTYVGSRGQLIFKLVPADSKEWEIAEMKIDTLDESFPLLGPKVGSILEVTVADNSPVPEQKEQTEIKYEESLPEIFNILLQRKVEQIESDKKNAEKEYEEDPSYGMF